MDYWCLLGENSGARQSYRAPHRSRLWKSRMSNFHPFSHSLRHEAVAGFLGGKVWSGPVESTARLVARGQDRGSTPLSHEFDAAHLLLSGPHVGEKSPRLQGIREVRTVSLYNEVVATTS